MPGGKRVGGGGRIANKPPPGGPRRDSRPDNSQASKQGLAIDTTSSHSKEPNSQVASPNIVSGTERNALKQQKSNGSVERSENQDGMVTPRNLPGNNTAGGSGSLPDAKRSMDDN